MNSSFPLPFRQRLLHVSTIALGVAAAGCDLSSSPSDVLEGTDDWGTLQDRLVVGTRVEAESYSSSGGAVSTTDPDGTGPNTTIVYNYDSGDHLCYANVNFGSSGSQANYLKLRLAGANDGAQIEVRLGSSTGTLLGTYEMLRTEGLNPWGRYRERLLKLTDTTTTGTQTVCLVAKTGNGVAQGTANLDWFELWRDPPNTTPSQVTVDTTVSPQVLKLDGKRFIMKGISYDPTEPGEYYWRFNYDRLLPRSDNNKSDTDLLQELNVNVIRTYGAVTGREHLDELYERGIRVVMQVWAGGNDNFHKATVKNFMDHPAILMWQVGNEISWNMTYPTENYDGNAGNDRVPSNATGVQWIVDRAEQIISDIKAIDTSHPVTVSWGNPYYTTLNHWTYLNKLTTQEAGDPSNSTADVLSFQLYENLTFNTQGGDLFAAYDSYANPKVPMWVSEYGGDSWDSTSCPFSNADATTGQVATCAAGESAQAYANVTLTNIIRDEALGTRVSGRQVAFGGSLFSFSDGWWKANQGTLWDNQAISRQDIGGIAPGTGPYPDLTFHEEFWGVLRLNRQTALREKKDAFDDMAAAYAAYGSCFDGVQNADETGVDCGGASCDACVGGGGAPAVASTMLEVENCTLSGFTKSSDTDGSMGDLVNQKSSVSSSTNSTASEGTHTVTCSNVNLKAGTYKLWTRSKSTSSSSNCLWVQFDGGTIYKFDNVNGTSGYGTGYAWDDVHDANNSNATLTWTTASAANRTIKFYNCEAGTTLDQVYVTSLGDSPAATACGNGIIENTEACDDGNTTNTDECTASCKNAVCGDNIVKTTSPAEECDDGNTINTDSCVTCRNATCSDGYQNGTETGIDCGGSCTACASYAQCGNGVKEGGEECDDGNRTDTDSCDNNCYVATCSDDKMNNGETGVDCGGSCTKACVETGSGLKATLQAENADLSGCSGCGTASAGSDTYVTSWTQGKSFKWTNVNLSSVDELRLTMGVVEKGGVIELRTDSTTGPVVASFTVDQATASWTIFKTYSFKMSTLVSGTKTLYMVAKSMNPAGQWLGAPDKLELFDGEGAAPDPVDEPNPSDDTNNNTSCSGPANCNFTSGTASWSFSGAGGTNAVFAVSSGLANVTRTSNGAGGDVRLYQNGLSLQTNKTYQICFDARIDSGTKTIWPYIYYGTSNFGNRSAYPSVTLTNNMTRHCVSYTTNGGTGWGLALDLGAESNTATIYIDNVTVQ